jgi:hypothetical protein
VIAGKKLVLRRVLASVLALSALPACELVAPFPDQLRGCAAGPGWQVIASDDFESGGWDSGAGAWLGAWELAPGEPEIWCGDGCQLRLEGAAALARHVDLSRYAKARVAARVAVGDGAVSGHADIGISTDWSNGNGLVPLWSFTAQDAGGELDRYEVDVRDDFFAETFAVGFESSGGIVFLVDDVEVSVYCE